MELACLDLEGVLVPEIWIAFSERTGIKELRATTRDIPDEEDNASLPSLNTKVKGEDTVENNVETMQT